MTVTLSAEIGTIGTFKISIVRVAILVFLLISRIKGDGNSNPSIVKVKSPVIMVIPSTLQIGGLIPVVSNGTVKTLTPNSSNVKLPSMVLPVF
jgi:hypothetical protein